MDNPSGGPHLCRAADGGEAMHRLRVASYNIRKCVGLDWKRDPERVLTVISGIHADVLALQEVDRRFGRRIATLSPERIERRAGLRPVEIGAPDHSLGWHGNAILVRPHVEPRATRRLELPGLEPRGAVLVEAEAAGAPLRIVGVHLGLTRAYRRRQLAAIATALDDPSVPTVILGDFNEWSPRIGLEPLSRFDIHAPGHSFHAAWRLAALDRIAVSPPLAVHRSGVFLGPEASRASDHLPIWADLALPGAAVDRDLRAG
jgi:endonuclease/exonuclease/phosphatase family metal-dependent hydrolase